MVTVIIVIVSSIVIMGLITMITDIVLLGRLSFKTAPKVEDREIIIRENNHIDIQTDFQCSAYSAAYVLRHFGIPAEGKELYQSMPDKMKNGYVYPKGLRRLLSGYGFNVKYCRGSLNSLKYELKKGNPVIVMILVRKDKNWLHYVPVVGYDEKYIYLAESLQELTNCECKYYNRKVEKKEFMQLWNTAMMRQPLYKNTYMRVRKGRII